LHSGERPVIFQESSKYIPLENEEDDGSFSVEAHLNFHICFDPMKNFDLLSLHRNEVQMDSPVKEN
jgi:hypothetical protein